SYQLVDDTAAAEDFGFQPNPPQAEDYGFQPTAPAEPDVSKAGQMLVDNVKAERDAKIKDMNPDQHEARTFTDDWLAGWQMSNLGLATRRKMPDTVLPSDAGRLAKI